MTCPSLSQVLVSLTGLTDACLVAVSKLQVSLLARFLDGPEAMALSSTILNAGIRVFQHIDRSKTNQERSEGYRTWKDKTFSMSVSFQKFIGEQVQASAELRDHARTLTVQVCNLLFVFAEEARSEYKFLNLACKCIDQLLPYCEDKSLQLERFRGVSILCDGLHGTLVELYHICKEKEKIPPEFFSRRQRISQFYCHYIKSMASQLFKYICQDDRENGECRGILRYLLFFMRGRLLTNSTMKTNHPNIHSELLKLVYLIEDIVPLAMFQSKLATDEQRLALIYEFAVAGGPRVVFLSSAEPLSEQEWRLGRVYFLLKTMTIFDEFSPALRLQLFPPEETGSGSSLLRMVVECVDSLAWDEILYPTEASADHDGDHMSIDIVSDLCTFANLLSERQFIRLQLEMTELVLGRSEFWSILARDWWICLSERLGVDFTRSTIVVLSELLSTLPVGTASMKISNLIRDLVSTLDDKDQMTVSGDIVEFMERILERDARPGDLFTFLTSFPFDILKESHQYVACLTSISCRGSKSTFISTETRDQLVLWSVEIVGGTQDLLQLVEDDDMSLSKVKCTIDAVIAFLVAMKPLEFLETKKVLNAISSWQNMTVKKRPISCTILAAFLESCSTVVSQDEQQQNELHSLLAILFESLGQDTDSTVQHASLMSMVSFYQTSASSSLVNMISSAGCEDVLRLRDQHGCNQGILDARSNLAQAQKRKDDYRTRVFPDLTSIAQLQSLHTIALLQQS
ncbi:hypothetical protein BGZ83_004028 [Gryganskiella cystojenkinii]|nr:hypothetical protein BGZ83_004028 [Gryganskiella cystojenkinii]